MTLATKQPSKLRRSRRVRSQIRGTAKRPRLTVFRSHQHLFAQIIDDQKGNTIVSTHSKTLTKDKKHLTKTQTASQVGKEIANKALKKKIKKVKFDRGPYQYHGRVKALSEAARDAGLEF